MSKIEIEKKNVDAAYKVADPNTKKVLDALFGETANRPTPTLDDYTTIQEYEDACVALGEKPICFENEAFIGDLDDDCEDYGCKVMNLPAHIIALIKLETISRALWGRNFQPKPDAEGKEIYWWAWFALYTKKEMEEMSPENRGALLSAYATSGAYAGFGYLATDGRSSGATAAFGFRLCQETDEKARYFGKQFIKLWAEYLKFNFEVQE
ncbi:MAG: hypothetical protein RRZ64_00315 [Rikenellaceae bacterium]